jgi:hypothetical protein
VTPPKLAGPPPCLCSHEHEEHPLGSQPTREERLDGRCVRAGCGCLRYRPDITVGMTVMR